MEVRRILNQLQKSNLKPIGIKKLNPVRIEWKSGLKAIYGVDLHHREMKAHLTLQPISQSKTSYLLSY